MGRPLVISAIAAAPANLGAADLAGVDERVDAALGDPWARMQSFSAAVPSL